MNSLVDIRKLNNLDVVKRLNSMLFDFFGLKLTYYPLSSEKTGQPNDSDEIYNFICSSSSKAKCKKILIKDIKKAVNKKDLVIHKCSPKIKKLILPVMVQKNVYGLVLSNEIKNQEKDSSKKKDDNKLKQLGTFLTSFVNYVFMSKFEEASFFSSEMAQTHLQESIGKAIEYIKQNYYRPNLSLSEVSEKVNLSPYYFSHQFKNEYNTTFIEHLTKVRLEAGVKLLKDFRLSIAQVSFAIGYQDPNYFSKVFKKWMNISPQEYRDQVISQKI